VPLKLHFLNVGHGDCTFIEFPSGRLTMIDVNNSTSLPDADQDALAAAKGLSRAAFKGIGISLRPGQRTWEAYYRSLLVDPYDFYQQRLAGRPIHRYLQTHPDLDHMTGLHNFFFDKRVPLLNLWDTDNTKTKTEDDFAGTPHAWADWTAYTALRNGVGLDYQQPKLLKLTREQTGDYWTQDGITILSPTNALVAICNSTESWNDASYVLRVDYGGRRVILPGDAEHLAWSTMLEALGTDALRCDLLKAAHHGRESGFHEAAAKAMSPRVVVCSVGKKPETDASDEYAALGADVLSTRYHGTISATIWEDGEVWVDDRAGTRIASLPAL
jgi:competence protein ComEC